MNITLFAQGRRSEACLRALIERQIIPKLVVVSKKTDSNILEHVANRYKIPLFKSENINADKEIEQLKRYKPDLIVMAGFTQIIKKKLLSIPRHGVLNLHGGKLPDYRGASVINWQIINGEPLIGLSIIFADEGIDTGDIVAEAEIPLGKNDTFTQVDEKVQQLFPEMLIQVIEKITNGTLKRKPQRKDEGTYWHKRIPADGRIYWHRMTAVQVHNLVRALTPPCPGAFCYLGRDKVIIWETCLLKETFKGVSGRIICKKNGGYVVMASDKGLLITSLELKNYRGRKLTLVGKTFT